MTPAPTAVVTGGAGGVGRVIVERLARDGRVVVLDLDEGRLERGRASTDAAAVAWVRADICVRASVDDALQRLPDGFAGPLTLVNCAGVGPSYRAALELDEEDVLRVMRVNVIGALSVARAMVPAMAAAGWGRIVNISSVTASGGWRARSEYAASKAALESFSASLAAELGIHGITVNCVAPGHMRTELTATGAIPWDPIIDRTVLGRLVEPAEVAEAVAYLTGAAAAGVTGAVLRVDAGYVSNLMAPGV